MKLEPIDATRPSVYNPRKTDPARLDLVKLSLRKLGFVLPLYANSSGEILSGHQRHLAAAEMGWTHVPVCRLPDDKKRSDKGLNLLFNRCTNDMMQGTNTRDLWADLSQSDIESFKNLPDAEDRFPCLSAKPMSVDDLAKKNNLAEHHYARNMASAARLRGVSMPLLIDRSGIVVNGAGRLRLAIEKKDKFIDCVTIPEDRTDFAKAMINKLSMDFSVEEKYADILRQNAFRRRMGTKAYLGKCFTFAILGSKPCHSFDINKPDHRAKWTRLFGNTVADFGAGLMDESRMLNAVGIKSIPFEPYVIGDDDLPDVEKSRTIVRQFLVAVESIEFHSVFASAILNSIPFIEDRRKVLAIIAATCGLRTTFYTHCVGAKAARLTSTKGADQKNSASQNTGTFLLDYEKNVTIGEIADLPKVQKMHEPQELHDLLSEFFEVVNVSTFGADVGAICRTPRKATPEKMSRAIEFEFDLPYRDGQRLGLVAEAKAAYSNRLGFIIP